MCNHENLRAVNDRLFCKDCGKELPLEFLAEKGAKRAQEKPEAVRTDKPTTRKRTAKKAD